MMNGDVCETIGSCVISIKINNRLFSIECFVAEILSSYDVLLVIDLISKIGGIKVNTREKVRILDQCDVAVVAESNLTIEDDDFSAFFDGFKWNVEWKLKKGNEPKPRSQVCYYPVKS